jgi:16S rRNA processing protein RimM
VATTASATGAQAAWPEDAVEVGRIVDAWGVKGWIKVQAFASDPQALFSSKRWYLQPPEDSSPVKKPVAAAAKGASAPFPSLLKIVQAKEHGDVVVAQAQEVEDRNAAEALRGARVFVPRSSFPTADADEYYWVDLIGMQVVNREGQALGAVVGLLDTGPHSVLRIQPAEAGAEERLVPFVSAYVDEVKADEKRITVDWGLDF